MQPPDRERVFFFDLLCHEGGDDAIIDQYRSESDRVGSSNCIISAYAIQNDIRFDACYGFSRADVGMPLGGFDAAFRTSVR